MSKASGVPADGVHYVHVVYKNDGLGINIEHKFEDPKLGDVFAAYCERQMAVFDTRDPKVAIRWLDSFLGRRPLDVDRETFLCIVATVGWLERRGHIESDDFNGVQWMGMRRGQMFVIRMDTPPPRELIEILRVAPDVEVRVTTEWETKLRELLDTKKDGPS